MSRGFIPELRRLYPRCNAGEPGNTPIQDGNESEFMFGIVQTQVRA